MAKWKQARYLLNKGKKVRKESMMGTPMEAKQENFIAERKKIRGKYNY